MATVQTLANNVLEDLGVMRPGYTPNATDSGEFLTLLNQVIASLSNEQTFVFNILHATFTFTAATGSYTMGPSAVWSTAARPVKIIGALAYSGTIQKGLDIKTIAEFRKAEQNGIGRRAAIPEMLAHDNTIPTITVFVYPTPLGTASIDIDYWTVITAFAALGDTITWPPGYELALRKIMTLEMAPMMKVPISNEMLAEAKLAKQAIQLLNAEILGIPATQQTAQVAQ